MAKCYQCIFDDRVFCDGKAFSSCEECYHYDSTVSRDSYLDIYAITGPNDKVLTCEVDEESGRILRFCDS